VTGDVSVQVAEHLSFGPAPLAVRPGQPVLVAAGEDRLQREVREGLEDGDVCGGGGGSGVLVDFDDDVGRDVLGVRQAVVEPYRNIRSLICWTASLMRASCGGPAGVGGPFLGLLDDDALEVRQAALPVARQPGEDAAERLPAASSGGL
jgi:hypothetical protein